MIFREVTLKNICFCILSQTEETWPHLALSSGTVIMQNRCDCTWYKLLACYPVHAVTACSSAFTCTTVSVVCSATSVDLLNRTRDSNKSFLLHPIKQQNNTENIQHSNTELLYKTNGDLQGLSSLYYRILHTAGGQVPALTFLFSWLQG